MNEFDRRQNAAYEELTAAVNAIRNAPDGADMAPLEQRFRAASEECERAQSANDNHRSQSDNLRMFHPTPAGDGSAASGDLFRDLRTGQTFRSFRHGEQIADLYRDADVNGVPMRDLDLGRALRGMVTGNWHGADAELRALSETGATSGQTLLPTPLSSMFIDYARAESVLSAAGAQVIPFDDIGGGTYKIAKATADPAVAWVAESGSITPADPTLGALEFAARKAAVLCKMSRELANDAPNADQVIRGVITAAVATAIDQAGLEGTGADDDMPLGLSGITTANGMNEASMGENGATPTNDTGPAKLLEVVKLVRQNNAIPSAVISSPRSWATFAGLKDSTKQPLRLGAGLDDLPWHTTSGVSDARTQGTSEVASNLYVGDFRQLFIAVRQSIEVYITRDAYIANDEIAILVTWRGDIAPARNASFARLVGVLDEAPAA